MPHRIRISRLSLDNGDIGHPGFKSLFDTFFSGHRPLFSLSERVWNPPADVYETKSSVVIKMEVAGMSLDNLDVQVNGGYLTIRGRRCENPCLDQENFHLMEIRYGAFERSFALPVKANHDEIQAQYNNGFLIVMIPKGSQPSRNIPVQGDDDK